MYKFRKVMSRSTAKIPQWQTERKFFLISLDLDLVQYRNDTVNKQKYTEKL